jgi:hypothetical protein
MSTAFDNICRSLNLAENAERERKTVAVRIVELARRGERDAARLSERILREAGTSV